MRSFHRVKPGDESLVVRSLPEPIINKPISQLFSVDSRRYIGARFCRLERFTHGQNLWFEAKVPRILQQILREKSCKRFNVSTSPPPFRRGAWIFSASPWKFPSEKNQATITRKIMFLVAEKKQFHQLSCRFQRISGKSWAIYLDHQETENLINLSF